MNDATTAFADDDRRQIEQAIADAEHRTTAEIVCAVATESGRYDRAESIVGLMAALLALGLAHILHGWLTSGPGDWVVTPLHVGWQMLAVAAGFVFGNVLASYVLRFDSCS